MSIEPLHLDDLIAQDVSMSGQRPFLDNPVSGVVLLPGDEENASLRPLPKEFVIDIPFVDRHNRAGRKGHLLGNLHLVTLPIGDVGKYRKVAVMVQKQVKFHRPFRLPELGPVEKTGAKLDDRGIETERYKKC